MVFIERIRSALTKWLSTMQKLGVNYIAVLVATILLAIAIVVLVPLTIQPFLKRRALTQDLVQARADLDRLQKLEQVNLENLTNQVQAAEQQLAAAYDAFPSTASAGEVLDTIYRLAAEAGVSVAELQGLGTESGEKGDVEITRYRLSAAGPIAPLSSFLSRIQTATVGTTTLNDVQVGGRGSQYELSMELAIHSSPLSTGPGQATPTAVPVGTPAPSVTPVSAEEMAALTQRLDAAVAAGNWPLVIDLAQQVRTADAAYPDINDTLYGAYVKYGSELLAQNRLDEASTQFTAALAVRPDGAEAQAGLAQAEAMAQPPTATPSPLPSPTLTADQQLQQAFIDANWEEALRLLLQIQSTDPGRAGLGEQLYQARVGYGTQLTDAGNYDKAKQQFAEALRLKPGGSEALDGLRRLEAIASGAVPTATIVPGQTPLPGGVHVVVRGDTLYSIARRYNTTVDAIMRVNGLTSSNIYVGQRLTIPGEAVPPTTGQVYIVQTGDTLFSISQRYATTVDAIMRANGLTSSTIYVGQRLVIPGR